MQPKLLEKMGDTMQFFHNKNQKTFFFLEVSISCSAMRNTLQNVYNKNSEKYNMNE